MGGTNQGRLMVEFVQFAKAVFEMPRYLPLIARCFFEKPGLQRINESSAATDGIENVANYDQVMRTKLAIFYAIGLEALHRISRQGYSRILDLAPGPGHFSLCMRKFLGAEQIKGIDLAQSMVDIANHNALIANCSNSVSFHRGDASNLSAERDHSYDLASMTFAAHHLPNFATLQATLGEMDRVVNDDGVVMILDLGRLPNKAITEQFIKIAGGQYKKQGLDYFYRDFYESMYAAWSFSEMRLAVPFDSRRNWYQLGMLGLPSLQILFGISERRPLGRLFFPKGLPWTHQDHLLIGNLRPEWWLARQLFFRGPRLEVDKSGLPVTRDFARTA